MIQKRDRVLIPSIVGLILGTSLIISGTVLELLDGTETSPHGCPIRGRDSACVRETNHTYTGFMFGFGIALTVGGATGIGISLFQASHPSSLWTP